MARPAALPAPRAQWTARMSPADDLRPWSATSSDGPSLLCESTYWRTDERARLSARGLHGAAPPDKLRHRRRSVLEGRPVSPAPSPSRRPRTRTRGTTATKRGHRAQSRRAAGSRPRRGHLEHPAASRWARESSMATAAPTAGRSGGGGSADDDLDLGDSPGGHGISVLLGRDCRQTSARVVLTASKKTRSALPPRNSAWPRRRGRDRPARQGAGGGQHGEVRAEQDARPAGPLHVVDQRAGSRCTA